MILESEITTKRKGRSVKAKLDISNKFKVFVYGTLRRGGLLHPALDGATFLNEAKTQPEFTLINLGDFPAMLAGGDTSIVGELYLINQETLNLLDKIEGHPINYKRQLIEFEDKSFAMAYIFNIVLPKNYFPKIIKSGDWMAFLNESSMLN